MMICPLDGEPCEECVKHCRMTVAKLCKMWRILEVSRNRRHKIACSHSASYKAMFQPKCNKGNPCDMCKARWANSTFNPESFNYVPIPTCIKERRTAYRARSEAINKTRREAAKALRAMWRAAACEQDQIAGDSGQALRGRTPTSVRAVREVSTHH